MFTVTLDEARELFAQPRPRSRAARAAAAAPLREIGADPASGKPIVLRDGRFGLYVTDGETNASLRKGDTGEEITLQRAVELLAERRAAAPSPRRPAGGSPARAGGAPSPGGAGGAPPRRFGSPGFGTARFGPKIGGGRAKKNEIRAVSGKIPRGPL